MRFPLAALLFAVVPATAVAQVGLLVVAHGADSGWNARVAETMAGVRWDRGPVRTAYLMGSGAATQSWDAGIAGLRRAGAQSIIVVPLMVSTSGEHVTQVRYLAGEIAELPSSLQAMGHDHPGTTRSSGGIRVTAALDAAPELGQILADRWRELPGARRSRALVLVAHGPSADELVGDWHASLTAVAVPLSAALGAQNVRVGLLRDDAEPALRAASIAALRDTITALAVRSGDSVTVMTVLVSSGKINRVKVPDDLFGMPMRYVGVALAPHPSLARWIERVASAAARP